MWDRVRRMASFWARVVMTAMPKALNSASGSWPPVITIAVGILGAGAVSVLTEAGSPWPILVALAGILLAIGEAIYIEWDRWAPHLPPRVDLRLDPQLWAVGLVIANNDPSATYRADVTNVYSHGDPATKLPFQLIWDGTGSVDREIARGQSARLTLVVFDPAVSVATAYGHEIGPTYSFPGPNNTAGLLFGPRGHFPGAHDPLTVADFSLRVVVRLFRVAPAPSYSDFGIWMAFEIVGVTKVGRFDPQSNNPAISSQVQT